MNVLKRIKALGIAPYEGVKEIMDKIALEKSELDLTTYTANLEDAIDIIKNSKENYEVIISRGGTAKLLEDYVDIPIVEISFTVYDILRSIDEAKRYTNSYSIVGYPNLTNTAKELCSILNDNSEIYTTYSHEGVDTTLELLKIKDVDLILADTVNYVEARKRGLRAILITSGEESVNIAFNEAISIGKVYRELQYENSLQKALQEMEDHIYCILNSNKDLIYKSIPHIDEKVFQTLKEYTDKVKLSQEKKFFFYIHPSHYHCKIKCAYLSGEVLYLCQIKKSEFSSKIYDVEMVDRRQALEDYLDSSFNITSSISGMEKQIQLASSSDKVVLLVGEIGTGKTEVAKRIYSISEYNNNPLYIIDLTNMDTKQQRDLFHNPESPIFEVQSSFFLKIDRNTEPAVVNDLIALIKNSRFSQNNKCIISYKLDFRQQDSDMLNLLMNSINTLPIYFSPLREYRSDIRSLASIYLNEKNSSLGKHILGYDEKALNLLEQYSWPQNFIQFWRVLDQIIEICDQDYISVSLTREIIETEDNIFYYYEKNNAHGVNLDLNRPLEEIIRDIILIALENNNNNQTKTAEQLGVSRSTIWRYLKRRF